MTRTHANSIIKQRVVITAGLCVLDVTHFFIKTGIDGGFVTKQALPTPALSSFNWSD